jgi:hypothetical protein
MILTSVLPSALADLDAVHHPGFSKGVTWKPFVPMKKTTFIGYDDVTLLDDYAYLASIPSSVFFDKTSDKLYTSPLLFYQEELLTVDPEKQTLNGRQGIDYFMQDWISYSKGTLDQITLINVEKQQLDDTWKAKNISMIQGTDTYGIASKIALGNWEYADEVVLAVIQENYSKPDNLTIGTLSGSISPGNGIKTEHFEVPQTNEVYPIYHDFTVPEGYKFLKLRSWYPCFYFEAGIPGFEGIINMSIPAGDRDIQVYCEEDGEWMMAAITSEWNAQDGMDVDKTSVYVYKSGRWSVALTDVPTKSEDIYQTTITSGSDMEPTGLEAQKHHSLFTFNWGRYGTLFEVLKNMKEVIYQVDVEMYPGIDIAIPDMPPFGCRNIQINLTWDSPDVDLGFSLIGPAGEEILSTREPGVSSTIDASIYDVGIPLPPGTKTDLHVHQLGQCLNEEQYSICVFAMNDIKNPVDFTIEYSWEQNFSEEEGYGLGSATQAAILASEKNAPLLYISPDCVPQVTLDTLYQLGTKRLSLVNIGDQLSDTVLEKLKNDFALAAEYNTYKQVYQSIRSISKSNDVIFSTIDPWTLWYVTALKPEEEMQGARSVGPAAYIAAHHGSPVLLVDVHPELSSAVAWHNELWRRHSDGHSKLPTVSEMYLTGMRVIEFLKEFGFDEEGEETIITVAGQFDIGFPWDRVFVGKGKPGRFFGSPVDLSVWISKNVFYPMIVFENPALSNPSGVSVINGSSSKRRFPWRGTLGLKITKPSEEETMQYPVLDTLVCYDIKFNSRASDYWGFEYKCADGTIPGRSQSFEPIDEGVMLDVNGQPGGFVADLSGAEVQPFYLRRGGFSPVFSTNFDANMYNLNQGVLLWMVNTHGAPMNGGMLMFWDVNWENPSKVGYPPIPLAAYSKETNPWRGYEWLMGSTEEPDTMTMEIHGVLPALWGNPDPFGIRFLKTGLDWAVAKHPVRDFFGTLASLPVLNLLAPDWFQNTQDYYDGVIITVLLGRFGTSWYNGTQIDEALGNIHSAGISSVACLPAGKYLQLTLMRHGSPFQIMDPWATSWYSDVWQNDVPRGIALGRTIGEIYAEGILKVGIQYVSDDKPNWWWDLAENVCLFGDPDLRVWVPSTTYSTKNHWEVEDIQSLRYDSSKGFSVEGHTPFGAMSHPNHTEPKTILGQYQLVIIAVAIIFVLLIAAIIINRPKDK